MALLVCPDCRRQVSDAAPACPGCGRPVTRPAPSFTRPGVYAADRPPIPPSSSRAGIASLLGILAPVTVGLTSIPAVLLGYRALDEIQAGGGRISGRSSAVVAIVLGCVGLVEAGVWIGASVGRVGVALGAVTVVGGVGLLGLGLRICTRLAWNGSRRTAMAVLPTALAVGGGVGMILWRADVAERLATCLTAQSTATERASHGDFDGARASIDLARRFCPPSEAATMSGLTPALERQEREAKQAAATRAAAEQVAAAETREREAVARFPVEAVALAGAFKRIDGNMRAGQWREVSDSADEAQKTLATYDGTTIAKTKAFVDLQTRLAGVRKQLQPQQARLERDEQKARDEDNARSVARGPAPTASSWDGSIRCVERYLKSVLNDPSSYKHDMTSRPVPEGDHWVVVTQYRAKNGFGATVLQTATFKIRQGEVISMDE